MAGIGGVIKDVVSESVESGAKSVVKGAAKGAQAVTNAQKGLYQKALNKAGAKITEGTANVVDRAINKNLGETVANLGARAERLGSMAESGVINRAAKGSVEDIVEEGGKQIAKKSINKGTLTGAAIGTISGAGVGGIAGMATGADEDNMKSMVVMGALAGGAGGAIVGKFKGGSAITKAMQKNAADTAADIANGAANHSVKDGAKGLMSKAGASVQNFADKGVSAIDDIGDNISKKITGKAGTKAEAAWTQEMLDKGYGLADLLDDGTVMGDAMNRSRGKAVTEAVENVTRKANTIGGAAQGAIMGSAGGAVIGGVTGGIDEDDTVLGGALKGGFIGGTLGGIGGGASGYFNNSAKVLSNTTANVSSLLGRG